MLSYRKGGITIDTSVSWGEIQGNILAQIDLINYISGTTPGTGYVPYNGATASVNLGAFPLTTTDSLLSGVSSMLASAVTAGTNFYGVSKNYALIGGDNVTNSTGKSFRLAGLHYTNTEEPIAAIALDSSVSVSALNYGGGPANANAVTQHNWFVAANNTTLAGTLNMQMLTGGNMSIGLAASASSAKLEVRTTASTGQFRASYSSTQYYNLRYQSTGGVILDAVGTVPEHSFRINGVEKARVEVNGIVLEGTTCRVFVNGNNSGAYLGADVFVPGESGIYGASGDERIAVYDPNNDVYYYFNGSLYGDAGTIKSSVPFAIAASSPVATNNFQIASGSTMFAVNNLGQLSVQNNGTFPNNTYYCAEFGNAISITGATAGFQISDRTNNANIWQHYSLTGTFRIYKNFGTGNAEPFVITNAGAIGINNATPTAKLDVVSTTEQLRLGYDASNFYSTTVSSAGIVTFDAIGASASFLFNDDVKINTVGKALYIKQGSGGMAGRATLVLGTLAITIAGLTTNDDAYINLITPGGTIGANVKAVCTANTLTLTAVSVAGLTVTSDTSTYSYFIVRPA